MPGKDKKSEKDILEESVAQADLLARMEDLLDETGQLTIQKYTEEAQQSGPLQAFSVVATVGEPSQQAWGKGDTMKEALEAMLAGLGR